MSSPTEQWVPKYTQNARKRLDALLSGKVVPETLIPPEEVVAEESKKIRTIQLQEDGSHSLLSDLLSFFSKKPH